MDLRFDLSFSYLLFMRVRMEATRLHNARCTMHDACFHLQFCDVIRRVRPHFSPLQDRKTSQPQGRKTRIKGQDTLKLVFLEESEELFIFFKKLHKFYTRCLGRRLNLLLLFLKPKLEIIPCKNLIA